MIYSWTNRVDIPGCNKQDSKFYFLSYYYGNSEESLVLNRTALFTIGQLVRAFACFTPIIIISGQVFFSSRITKLSELKNYSTDEKRDIFNTFDSEDQIDQGLPLDPFDFMNRLKQAGAMNDATTPSDALDEALNAFDQSEYENFPNE